MSQTADLERAFASTAGVLAVVNASQLDDPTPCASWKVRDLINHTVGAVEGFGNVATGQPMNTGPETDYVSGDYNAAFAEQGARVVAFYSTDGAMEQMMELPFGTMPGSAMLGLVMTDAFTHGWDLARATGQSTDLDPEIAQELLDRARKFVPPSFRGEDGKAAFGPEVAVADSAPAADRLAGFLGRQV